MVIFKTCCITNMSLRLSLLQLSDYSTLLATSVPLIYNDNVLVFCMGDTYLILSLLLVILTVLVLFS